MMFDAGQLLYLHLESWTKYFAKNLSRTNAPTSIQAPPPYPQSMLSCCDKSQDYLPTLNGVWGKKTSFFHVFFGLEIRILTFENLFCPIL